VRKARSNAEESSMTDHDMQLTRTAILPGGVALPKIGDLTGLPDAASVRIRDGALVDVHSQPQVSACRYLVYYSVDGRP
jgi:hypothetical protein